MTEELLATIVFQQSRLYDVLLVLLSNVNADDAEFIAGLHNEGRFKFQPPFVQSVTDTDVE